MYYIEHRPSTVRRSRPKFVPIDTVGIFGFRSVYAYSKDLADLASQENTTTVMRGQPVYSDRLFVEFDNDQDAAREFLQFLQKEGIVFAAGGSGNRSIHFHIGIEPMEGVQVPQLQKAWVRQHAPKADISFYHYAGMFRLNGTYHAKNPGKRKELTFVSPGEKLRIEVPQTDNVIPMPTQEVEQEDLLVILSKLFTTPVQEGGRHIQLAKVLRTMYNLNYEADVAYNEAVYWSSKMSRPPLPEHEILKNVRCIWKLNGQVARL